MKTPIAKMNTTKLADFLTETEKIATEALQLIDSNSYFLKWYGKRDDLLSMIICELQKFGKIVLLSYR